MKTSIRYLAVIFAVAMMICAFTSVSASFPDVESSNPHAAAIETMTNLGILGGYEDGTFQPDGLVRRCEMAKIIFVTAHTFNDTVEGATTFPDVKKNNWAAGYISWCAENGIVGGYEDGTFRPDGNITYDEALKMVCVMLGYKDFSPAMWPTDVRTKALIDLELNEELEDVAGETPLTRAQVVQLVYNAFDKPMYTENAAKPTDTLLGILGSVSSSSTGINTLKDSVWKYKEYPAQVVATENYGFVEFPAKPVAELTRADAIIDQEKTDDPDAIVVRIVDGDNVEYKTLSLTEYGLEEYVGKSDELLTRNINLITIGTSDEYITATLKGNVKEGISGALVDAKNYPDSKRKAFDAGNLQQGYYALYEITLDGVKYKNDEMLNLKRLTYYDDVAVATYGCYNLNGSVSDSLVRAFSYNNTSGSRWNECIQFTILDMTNLTAVSGFQRYSAGIDKDGDGYYDYLILEYADAYKVKKITAKSIEFEYLYKNRMDYVQVEGVADIPAMDMVFPKDNVSMLSEIEEGDIVVGYAFGDTFTVMLEPTIEIGYATSVKSRGSRSQTMTLNTGKSVGGPGYPYYKLWNTHRYFYGDGNDGNTNFFVSFNESMNPLLGVNVDTGNYNYAKYWVVDGAILYAEPISVERVQQGDGGLNKAILLYVTEATKPQINEATKEFEVFYPAYLVINGRTQLVNLNATNAINGFSGETVSDDGSEYRPYIKDIDGDGIARVMYPNKLVTYTIDSKGYYTLSTTASTITNDEGVEIERVLVAEQGKDLYMVIDEKTGLVTIEEAVPGTDPVEYVTKQAKIVFDENTVIYYPYTKNATGEHEYIDYYKGDEIPTDFARVKLDSEIYLTYDKETTLYKLSSVVIDDDFSGMTTTDSDYKMDAREHLFAVTDMEQVAHGEEVCPSYNFKKLYTYEDVTGVNKAMGFNEATDIFMGGIYAWDETQKDYVSVENNPAVQSLKNDTVTEILDDMSIIFTYWHAEGLKIDDTVKIIAITDAETAETRVITFEELVDVYNTIKQYDIDNENAEGTTSFVAKVGTYEDNNKTKLAYILIDWFEYNEEIDTYTKAGVEYTNP